MAEGTITDPSVTLTNDLTIAVEGHDLGDLSSFASPVLVMKGGEILVDRAAQ